MTALPASPAFRLTATPPTSTAARRNLTWRLAASWLRSPLGRRAALTAATATGRVPGPNPRRWRETDNPLSNRAGGCFLSESVPVFVDAQLIARLQRRESRA